MSARVLITGASGGIGSAASAALRARGARVIGLDLREDPEHDVLACDVRDQAAVDRAVATAIERSVGSTCSSTARASASRSVPARRPMPTRSP